MASVTLTSWTIQNNEDNVIVASDINPKISKLAFGDLYTGLFNYTTDVTINSSLEVRFNIGLFVEEGFDDITNLGGENESYYLRGRNLSSSWSGMAFVGPSASHATGRNDKFEIKKVTATTFQIRVRFYMTSDTNAYLGAVTSGQYSRFTSDVFSQNPTIFQNTNSTMYTSNTLLDNYCIGLYCRIKYKSTPQVGITLGQAVIPYTSTAAFTATRIDPLPINFLTDGWDNPCGLGTGPRQVQITVRQLNGSNTLIDYTFTGTLNPALTTANQLFFTSSVNFPLGFSNYFTVTEFVILPCGDEFTYGILGEDSGSARTWDYLNVDGLFANDGSFSNRTFTLKRNGSAVTNLHSSQTTTLEFEYDYVGTPNPTGSRVWFIPTSITNTTTVSFYVALMRTQLQFRLVDSHVALGGGRYRDTYIVNPLTYSLVDGYYFHFLFVAHDTTNKYYSSYSLQNIPVNSSTEVPTDAANCPVQMTGHLSTYKDQFETDYLQVSPLQRVKATVIFDKAQYNTCEPFTNATGVKAQLKTLSGALLAEITVPIVGGNGTSTNANVFVINNTTTLEVSWVFRIENQYANSEIKVEWTFTSLVEPTTTLYYQQFKVDDYQQNLTVPNQILTSINFYDSAGFLIPEGGTNCEGTDIKVETIKIGGSDDYGQAAIWRDNDNLVTEEDGFVGGIPNVPTLTNGFQSGVESQFSTAAPNTNVIHFITSAVDNGEVGIVGYPPPLPVGKKRIMLHHTLPNGRNIVFQAQDEIGGGTKTFASLGGLSTSAVYTFRVGNTSAALSDANNGGWGSFASISYALFSALTIPVNTYVRVEYNGTATQTDIASYIDYVSGMTSVPTKILTKSFPQQIAAGDVMLYTGTDTNFNLVTATSATRFTEKRTSAEIIASSDLTDYVSGSVFPAATWNPPNSTTGNHLYLEKNALTGLNSVGITTTISTPNLELSTYATPLSNLYYPVTGNGVNQIAVKGDVINDRFIVPDSSTGARNFWVSNMAVGEERTYTTLSNRNCWGHFASNTHAEEVYLNYSHAFLVNVNNSIGRGGFRFDNPPSSTPSYYTFRIRRKAASGTMANCFDVDAFVNGRKLNPISITGSMYSVGNPYPGVGYNLSALYFSNIAFSTIAFWQMNKRWMTTKEIREMHLGQALPAEYKYVFDNIVGGKVLAAGTIPHEDCLIQNHTGLTTNLF